VRVGADVKGGAGPCVTDGEIAGGSAPFIVIVVVVVPSSVGAGAASFAAEVVGAGLTSSFEGVEDGAAGCCVRLMTLFSGAVDELVTRLAFVFGVEAPVVGDPVFGDRLVPACAREPLGASGTPAVVRTLTCFCVVPLAATDGGCVTLVLVFGAKVLMVAMPVALPVALPVAPLPTARTSHRRSRWACIAQLIPTAAQAHKN